MLLKVLIRKKIITFPKECLITLRALFFKTQRPYPHGAIASDCKNLNESEMYQSKLYDKSKLLEQTYSISTQQTSPVF